LKFGACQIGEIDEKRQEIERARKKQGCMIFVGRQRKKQRERDIQKTKNRLRGRERKVGKQKKD